MQLTCKKEKKFIFAVGSNLGVGECAEVEVHSVTHGEADGYHHRSLAWT